VFEPVIAGAVCLAGFMTIDLIYFFLSRTGSRWIKKMISRFSESFLNGTKQKLQHQMPKTIIVLCFVPRMRFRNPILVSIMNLSFRRFLLYDSIGLALFTAVYITIGVLFHRSLSALIAEMEIWRHVIFVAVVIIIAAVIIFISGNRKNRTAHKPAN
jgi:membrane protein DedA with SNARE-associated domain